MINSIWVKLALILALVFPCSNCGWFSKKKPDKPRYYQPLDAFERQFAACLKHDTVNRLNHITMPTLIMSGDDDPLVPPENSRILKELILHSELYLFPRCRHCLFIEEADQFNQKVLGFFKSC